MRLRTLVMVVTVGTPALLLDMGVGSLDARPTRSPEPAQRAAQPSRQVCIDRCDETARHCLERCPMHHGHDCTRICITAEYQCQGLCPAADDGGVAPVLRTVPRRGR